MTSTPGSTRRNLAGDGSGGRQGAREGRLIRGHVLLHDRLRHAAVRVDVAALCNCLGADVFGGRPAGACLVGSLLAAANMARLLGETAKNGAQLFRILIAQIQLEATSLDPRRRTWKACHQCWFMLDTLPARPL